jgi:hypothetical protein
MVIGGSSTSFPVRQAKGTHLAGQGGRARTSGGWFRMYPETGLGGHHSKRGCRGGTGVDHQTSPGTALYRENKIEASYVRSQALWALM